MELQKIHGIFAKVHIKSNLKSYSHRLSGKTSLDVLKSPKVKIESVLW